MISSLVCAKPHPKFHARKKRFDSWITRTRPYSSLRGPSNRGPKAKARTKTETTRARSTVPCIPSSSAMCGAAGASMEDETGVMNVNSETMIVARHFFARGQLKTFVSWKGGVRG